jgi:hypothetical protein
MHILMFELEGFLLNDNLRQGLQAVIVEYRSVKLTSVGHRM